MATQIGDSWSVEVDGKVCTVAVGSGCIGPVGFYDTQDDFMAALAAKLGEEPEPAYRVVWDPEAGFIITHR